MPAPSNRDLILCGGLADATTLDRLAVVAPALAAALDAPADAAPTTPLFRVRAELTRLDGGVERFEFAGPVTAIQAHLLGRIKFSDAASPAIRVRTPHIYDGATGEHLTAAAPVWWELYDFTRALDATLKAAVEQAEAEQEEAERALAQEAAALPCAKAA